MNWNTRALLLACLESVFSIQGEHGLQVIVVDNGSHDGSVAAIRHAFPAVTVIENGRNLGFARAVNRGLSVAAGPFILLLNSDARITWQSLITYRAFFDAHPKVGVVGGNYLNEDGSRQNSFDNFPTLTTELLNKSLLRLLFPKKYPSKRKQYTEPLEVESVIGAAMMVRKEAIDSVGMLDEDYFFFIEETDWCLRMRDAGWKIYHLPNAPIYHLQGKSKEKDPGAAWIEYYRSLYLFFRKHRGLTAYWILRIVKLAKLGTNWLLTLAGLGATMGRSSRLRRKFRIYSRLLLWHLRFCPSNAGLEGK